MATTMTRPREDAKLTDICFKAIEVATVLAQIKKTQLLGHPKDAVQVKASLFVYRGKDLYISYQPLDFLSDGRSPPGDGRGKLMVKFKKSEVLNAMVNSDPRSVDDERHYVKFGQWERALDEAYEEAKKAQ